MSPMLRSLWVISGVEVLMSLAPNDGVAINLQFSERVRKAACMYKCKYLRIHHRNSLDLLYTFIANRICPATERGDH